jgi:hypothetical protein
MPILSDGNVAVTVKRTGEKLDISELVAQGIEVAEKLVAWLEQGCTVSTVFTDEHLRETLEKGKVFLAAYDERHERGEVGESDTMEWLRVFCDDLEYESKQREEKREQARDLAAWLEQRRDDNAAYWYVQRGGAWA